MIDPNADLQPGQVLARGVCRFLIDEGLAPVTELSPVRGLRTDVMALAPNGDIWVVECKSSVADFRSDAKWEGYLDWCDRFYFAGPADLPDDLLPEDHGLMIADGYGAEIVRQADKRPLAAARRKALTQRIARVSALRLRTVADPGVAGLISAGDLGDG